jgi:hypothetical protein
VSSFFARQPAASDLLLEATVKPEAFRRLTVEHARRLTA